MYVGYVDGEGRTYYRCDVCGDSNKNPKKAHAFIDRYGKTYCYRCNHYSELSIDQMLAVSLGLCDIEEVREEGWTPPEVMTRKSKITRPTLLTKFEAPNNADAFSMRDRFGRLVGWHTRYADRKNFHNDGDRGINWVGADDDVSLVSTPESPLVIVEGVFDVVGTKYATVFGSISYSTLQNFRGHHLVVFPDPDVIATKHGRKKFVELMQKANDDIGWVQGLISANDDPDKATKQLFIPLDKAVNYVRRETS